VIAFVSKVRVHLCKVRRSGMHARITMLSQLPPVILGDGDGEEED
jgi:hypothetical protein